MGDERSDVVLRVARRIAARRREKHLTQEAFATLLGIATKNVQRIESGKQNLSLETLARIAAILDTTPEALLSATSVAKHADLPRVLLRLKRAAFTVRPAFDRGRRAAHAVPVTTLRAAAGQITQAGRVTEIVGWVTLAVGEGGPQRFVAEIEGRSMAPRIRSGSLCLFEIARGAPRRGSIVLVTVPGLVDDDIAHYALKRIGSVRRLSDERTRVVLESINPRVAPIVVETHEDDDLRIVAALVRVLVPGR